MAIQPDGKIVAVGYGENFGVARYNPDGSLDRTFAGDGTQAADFAPTGVALQGNGKIVTVGGAIGASQTGDFALARYLGG